MKSTISKHPLISFFVMAFLFSWIAVTPLILNPELPIEPFQILGALVGPTFSAIIVTAATEGRAGLRKFFKRYFQWRARIGWWLFVLFGILIALNITAMIFLGPAILTELFQNLGLFVITYMLTLIAGLILGPLWEEPGWRGFALPRLQEQFGTVLGTVILGILWALWHTPGYMGGWMEVNILVLILSSVAFSIIMTWVYNNTRGSILLMTLLHSSSNAAISAGGNLLPAGMSESMHSFVYGGWIPAITYSILALVVIIVTRGKLSHSAEIRDKASLVFTHPA